MEEQLIMESIKSESWEFWTEGVLLNFRCNRWCSRNIVPHEVQFILTIHGNQLSTDNIHWHQFYLYQLLLSVWYEKNIIISKSALLILIEYLLKVYPLDLRKNILVISPKIGLLLNELVKFCYLIT